MKKATQTSDFSRVTNADLIVIARALGQLPVLEYDPAAKAALALVDAALENRPVGYVLPVNPATRYQRGDDVKVRFPIPGLGREIFNWCYVEHVLTNGNLEVVARGDEMENVHEVSRDRIAEHRPHVVI